MIYEELDTLIDECVRMKEQILKLGLERFNAREDDIKSTDSYRKFDELQIMAEKMKAVLKDLNYAA